MGFTIKMMNLRLKVMIFTIKMVDYILKMPVFPGERARLCKRGDRFACK